MQMIGEVFGGNFGRVIFDFASMKYCDHLKWKCSNKKEYFTIILNGNWAYIYLNKRIIKTKRYVFISSFPEELFAFLRSGSIINWSNA